MADITITAVKKSYGRAEVLHGLDIGIKDGEFIVIVGPSGCGKSTLLRIIAGLEKVTDGEIAIAGRCVNELEPMDRNIAMVFQNYALYPHMSVFQNLAYGLKIAKTPNAEIQQRVKQAAELLQLTELLERKPKDLSGGQRQRVAMGRAIVRKPAVFLFDEPLSNLDAALRVQTRIEIAGLHERMPGATMIYVTHDQVEAMTLADKIVVLRDGRVEQAGSPRQLYESPQSVFVAQFIGSPKMNILPGKPAADGFRIDGHGVVASAVESRAAAASCGIRPEHIRIVDDGSEPHCRGRVEIYEYLGADSLVYADCGAAGVLTVRVSGGPDYRPGAAVKLRFDESGVHLFDAGGRALA